MFNGLIREIAEVRRFDGNFLRIKAKYTPQIGDSIAVNGACLSVVALHSDGFEVELSERTQRIIAKESYKDLVHIEPAMTLNTRIDGHLVAGHIDGVGKILNITQKSNYHEFVIGVSDRIFALLVDNGSICVSGVSLTIAGLLTNAFKLAVIPLTMRETLFHRYRIGDVLNIEADMIVKNIQALLKKPKSIWQELDDIAMGF